MKINPHPVQVMHRFSVHSEVVTDTRTGLMWTRNAALSEFPLTWTEALDFVAGQNRSRACGHDDWRLPNRRQLFSLMSREQINPSLPAGHPFENVFTGYYWTATSCARLPDQAWYVHLGGARVFKGMKHGSYMVWPVRPAADVPMQVLPTGQRHCYDPRGRKIDCANSGQDGAFQSGRSMAFPRFTAEGALVSDRATGLTWTKIADGAGEFLDWTSARQRVAQMNQQQAHGYTDWRLPHIVELESLTDMDTHSPALPAGHPFVKVGDACWSGTTSRYDTEYAWVLYLRDGAVGVGYKRLAEFHLWPVRGKPFHPAAEVVIGEG